MQSSRNDIVKIHIKMPHQSSGSHSFYHYQNINNVKVHFHLQKWRTVR